MKCKNCNIEIPEDSAVKVGEDYFCQECIIYLTDFQEPERQDVQVTREMAMDAGDPSMEGAWIKW